MICSKRRFEGIILNPNPQILLVKTCFLRSIKNKLWQAQIVPGKNKIRNSQISDCYINGRNAAELKIEVIENLKTPLAQKQKNLANEC